MLNLVSVASLHRNNLVMAIPEWSGKQKKVKMDISVNKPVTCSKSWSEQKAQLKQRFIALTDDGLNYKEGKAVEMINKIQAKLGISREEFATILEGE